MNKYQKLLNKCAKTMNDSSILFLGMYGEAVFPIVTKGDIRSFLEMSLAGNNINALRKLITNIKTIEENCIVQKHCDAGKHSKVIITNKLTMQLQLCIEDFSNNGTVIIAGFPGTGKSYYYNHCKDYDKIKVLDSDSSQFSWIEKGVRNPDFPQNYINHIKENIGVADIIFVSTHDVVRKALKDNKMPYILASPNYSGKEEYLERYKQRGSDESFIKMMDKNWDMFISSIADDNYPLIVLLKEGEHIMDNAFISNIIIGNYRRR